MALKDDIKRVEVKVDKVDEKLDIIDNHMGVYNQQLKEHMRRTELLEEELKPIVKHVSMVQGALTVLTSSGIILGIIKLIDYFGGK